LQIILLNAALLAPLLATADLREQPSPPGVIYLGGSAPPRPQTQPPAGEQTRQRGRRGLPGKTPFVAPPRIPSRVAPDDTGEPQFDFSRTPLPIGERIPGGVEGGDPNGFPAGTRMPPAPAEPPKPKPRLKISEGALAAMLVHRVEPRYPRLAVQIRLEGVVALHAIIGRDGAVKQLEVLSGHPILAQAAREAILQWRYQPALLNREPVEVESHIRVNFTLRR
jgi:protein TonB